ncbi:signal peptide peptidase SppA [Phycisphaerales bacterium AB-hyl4]|uniref:Signal peptide peptidase SppA n=1 Tax=Natronomicrosphaera hydrolytica TaxID=3242702 RepID=A0ABV4U4I5_9BACT
MPNELMSDHPVTDSLGASPAPRVDLGGVDVPPQARLDEYYGLWAVEESRFWALFQRARNMDWGRHFAEPRARRGQTMAVVRGPRQSIGSDGVGEGPSVVVLQARGTLMKHASSLDNATSTVELRRQIRAASRDSEIGGIMIVFESPGGSVAGTPELAREIRLAAERKPVFAFVEDLAASAAYYAASQATRIYANDRTALVGSIGTVMATYDVSKLAERQGIEAVAFTTGPYKAAGMPGAPITPEQRAYFQDLVDRTQTSFSDAVVEGRGLTAEQLAAVETGQVWLADQAMELKLIDNIQSFDDSLAELMQLSAEGGAPSASARHSHRAQETRAMPETQQQTPTPGPAPAPAPNADADAPSPAAAKPDAATTPAPSPEATVDAANTDAGKAAGSGDAAEAAASRGASAEPATLAQLKEAFPNASAEFREQCQEQGFTLGQASTAYAKNLEQQLTAEREASDELRQRLGQTDRGGDEAVVFQAESSPEDARRQKMGRHMGSAAAALTGAVRISGRSNK